MGQTPTDEELFQMINDVDDNASGSIGMFFFSLSSLSLFCVVGRHPNPFRKQTLPSFSRL